MRGLAQILEELDQAGVLFRSATEPFDTGTPAGRMMVQMLGVFAEFERATLIDRVVAGMERKAARGGCLGGVVPFGYQLDSASGLLTARAEEAAVVSLIFEHCKSKRLGSRAIAMWLNERGYRTRSGRPWGHKAVLQILRNPVYAGQVAFRGVRHDAAHARLLDEETFASCGEILDARGEDAAEKRRNPTDYLLSGLLRCERCGKSYLGTSAHGKLYRYRYYTCFSRHRYGRHGCEAERLPAERLDQAVIEALVRTYEHNDLVAEAIRKSQAMAERERPHLQEQLAAVETEIRKAEEARQRYFVAFEAGTMREEVCAERLEVLQQKLSELREHHGELTQAIDYEGSRRVSDQDLVDIRSAIRTAIERGSPQEQKALLKALVAEIRVESRKAIYPVFRVPEGGVRVLGQMVGREGVEHPKLSRRFYRPTNTVRQCAGTHVVVRRTRTEIPTMTAANRRGSPRLPSGLPSDHWVQ